MVDDLGITHHGRTETVNRALTDFGIEDSFGQASKRFEEHYGFRLSESAVDRVTKTSGLQGQAYLAEKFLGGKQSQGEATQSDGPSEPVVAEVDGCEIRTGTFVPVESGLEDEKPTRKKMIKWRDVRVGLARPLNSQSKLYVAKMEKYPEVISQLACVASMHGMTSRGIFPWKPTPLTCFCSNCCKRSFFTRMLYSCCCGWRICRSAAVVIAGY